ncbi:SDR family NAD(P)-dependent oxidoreductase [Paenibacillus montanisoli]|uniref:Short-chain dehydrogenase n=1 Tax=Paenibacillus montanisoli TaxID=2081970 RepID=A0A328UAF6_9BACL|nr:SDR family oxidoreductase [Paenibacillus montanisoli]RAP77915.1 short-chain dehydrogenase [Paenibacillus montanisoli]
MNLAGKIALVTGSGKGLGKGIAIELARRGARIAVHYNASDAGAIHTKQQIEDLGGEAIIVKANVAVKSDIDHLIREVAGHYGGIDILVNNAALQLNFGFFDHNEDTYDRIMRTNAKGYWQCMQAVIPYMKRKQSGRIINVSSVHGKRPTDFDVVYAMSKGAITMLGREAAIELAKYGITVNTVEPGAIDVGKPGTSETRSIITPEEAEKLERERKPDDFIKRFPLGRVGMPADVAAMICYLASEEAEYITGASIRIDGASMLM